MNKVNFTPDKDKFLIATPHISKLTAGGIEKSDQQVEQEEKEINKRPHQIVAVGSGIIDRGYKIGDYIYLAAGTRSTGIPIGDTVYLVIEGYDILGKVEDVALFEAEAKVALEKIEKEFEGKGKKLNLVN